MAMKSWFLLLDTSNHGEIVKAKIEDGCVIIKDKQFIVDTSNPILIKKGGKLIPLYILKWSSTKPSNLNSSNPALNPSSNPSSTSNPSSNSGIVQEVEDVKFQSERIKPRFEDKYDLTPEMLRKIMGLKILGNMIKVPKKTIGTWVWFLIGGLAIFIVVYALIVLGWIKF